MTSLLAQLGASAPRPRQVRRALITRSPALFLLALLGFLVLLPIVVLIVVSFFTGQPGRLGEFTFNNWGALIDTGLLPVMWNSIAYATLRAGGGLILALLFAWAVARTNVPGRGLIGVCLTIPFLVPNFLVSMSWIFLGNPQSGLVNTIASSVFGADGPIMNIYSWFGLGFLSIQSSTSFLFIMLVPFFYLMDPSHEEAAISLGASRRRTVMTITFPMLAPAITGATLLEFIRGLEAFEGPLLIGSPAGIYMFSNEIFRILKGSVGLSGPKYGQATAYSMVLLILTFALVVMQWRILGTRQFTTVSGKGFRPQRIELGRVARWSIVGLFLVYFLVSVVIPGGMILAGTFFTTFGYYNLDTLTLNNWGRVLADLDIRVGIKNTILFSAAAAAVVVFLGGMIGYIRVRVRKQRVLGRALELLAWVPWTMPGLVLALALLWTWLLLPPPYNLYGTGTLIIIGFVVKGLPLGTRTMHASIGQLSEDLEEASRVHGASWSASLRHITVPLLRRGMFSAFILIFALSARDLAIPILLYGFGNHTITVSLLEYFYNGAYTVVCVVAVVQLLIIFSLVALERFTQRGESSD